MSGMNLAQVYAANPITSNTNTDLMYFDVGGADAAMEYLNFVALNATNATKVQTTAVNTNATWFPLFVASSSNGNQAASLATTGLGFNPNTGTLTATAFSGPLTGNVTGNASGSSGSCTGNAATASAVAVGGITGLGTGVATALAINVGSAGAPVLFNGAGGTPSSMTGTNITGTAAGLTAGTASAVAVGGITGLGTGVATALAVNTGSAGAFAVLGSDNIVTSSSCGNFSGTAASPTAITNLSAAITTVGGAVQVTLQPDGTANFSYFGNGSVAMYLYIYRGATLIAQTAVTALTFCQGITIIDKPTAGTYTYSVKYQSGNGVATVYAQYSVLNVREN